VDHDPRLLDALEPGQLSAALALPVPKCKVGRAALTLLIMLRLYVIVAIPIVGYTFAQALVVHHP
jgi:hypothetical protein